MKKIFAYLLTGCGILIGFLIISLTGLLIFAKSPAGLNWLQNRINDSIAGRVAMESHRLSLFSGHLEIRQAVLKGPDGEPLAGFDRFWLDVSWSALLGQELRISDIGLEKPWARLRLDREGHLNLLAAFPPAGSKTRRPARRAESVRLPVNIVVQSLSIRQGQAEFENQSTAVKAIIGQLALSADGNLKAGQANLKLSAADIHLTTPAAAPPPFKLELSASLDPTRSATVALNFGSAFSQLIAKGTIADVGPDPTLDLTAQISSDLAEWQRTLGLSKASSGTATVRLTIKGRALNPDAALMLEYGGGRVQGQAVTRADLALNLTDRKVALESGRLQAAGGSVNLTGAVDLQPAFAHGLFAAPRDLNAIAYHFEIDQQAPHIGPWVGRAAELSGSLNSRLTLSGEGVVPARLSARLAVDLTASKLKTPALLRPIDARLTLQARIVHQTLDIQRLEATVDSTRIRGNGRYGFADRTMEGQLGVEKADLTSLLTLFGVETVKGQGSLAVSAQGSLDRPVLDLHLDARNLSYDHLTLGNVKLQGGLGPDRKLKINTFQIENQGSEIRASAKLGLQPEGWAMDEDFISSLRLNFKEVELRDFVAKRIVDGNLNGELTLKGSARALKGDLSIHGRQLETAMARLGNLDARLHLDRGVVAIDEILLDNQGSQLKAQGRINLFEPQGLGINLDPAFQLQIHAPALEAKDFVDSIKGRFFLQADLSGRLSRPYATLSMKAENVDLGAQRLGKISLDLAGQGSIQNPDVDGQLLLEKIRIDDKPFDDVHLNFSLHDHLARTCGNLNFALDASYHLEKKDFEARVKLDRTELGSYFKMAGIKQVHGALSGLVTLKGNANALKDVRATIDLSDLQLFYQKAALIQAKAIKARVAHGTLSTSTAGIEMTLLAGGLLELKGSATLDGPIDLACHTRIPLTDVGPFVEGLSDATGSVELTGRIAGTFSRPDFEGRIDLSDIGLTVPVLLQKVHDLKGRIAISKGALRVESLSGFLDTGRFAAKGQMAYEGLQLQEIHLTLDVDALPLEIPDTLSVLLTSRLTLDGEPEKCEAKGEIVILEGVYFKEVKFNLLDAVSKPKRTVAPPKTPLTVAFLKNMLLDIAVRNRDPLLIQNNLADLELKPDLHLGGTLNNPVIDGWAKVQAGSMYFQKKTFEVQKGVIDFVNPYKTEAKIDIVGETQVRTWKIILALKGSPDDLLLTLTSVPEESNSDILSLLLFGKTGQELASGQGSGKRSTSQIMTEMLADAFGSDLKKTTGVDILDLESTDGQDSESSGGLKVTLGKHLSQRMTVKYSVETKDGETIQRAISEYKFLEHILASGFQDTQGVYGGELVFRIEFR